MHSVVHGDKELCVSVEDDGLHPGPRVCVWGGVCVCVGKVPSCRVCMHTWSELIFHKSS